MYKKLKKENKKIYSDMPKLQSHIFNYVLTFIVDVINISLINLYFLSML